MDLYAWLPRPARRRRMGVARMVGSVVAAFGVFVAAGCEKADDPSPPEKRGVPATFSSHDRHARLDVAEGSSPGAVIFGDATTGYVIFSGCLTPCPASLFTTVDGGRTWRPVVFDGDGGDFSILTVVNPTTVMVSGLAGHYVSRDGGRSFVLERIPPADIAAPLSTRAVRRCSQQDAEGHCDRWEVAKEGRAVAVQPPLTGPIDSVAEDAAGTIYAVSHAADTIRCMVSADGGSTWRATPALRRTPAVGHTRIVTSSDGRDTWLLVADPGGRLTAYVAVGGGWRQVADNIETGFAWTEAIGVGDGAIAVYGKGLGYLGRDGGWSRTEVQEVTRVEQLADGTLVGHLDGNPGLWLGVGAGTAREWSFISVEAA